MVDSEFVRPARPDDAPHVQALLRSENLEDGFLAKEFVVVEVGGRLIGCARARRLPEGGTEFSGLVIHPEYRGRGLARSLYEMALLGARHPVYLLTPAANLARRAGFEPVPPEQLPPSLRARAASAAPGDRPWNPMRLRRIEISPLPPEPVGEPDFLES